MPLYRHHHQLLCRLSRSLTTTTASSTLRLWCLRKVSEGSSPFAQLQYRSCSYQRGSGGFVGLPNNPKASGQNKALNDSPTLAQRLSTRQNHSSSKPAGTAATADTTAAPDMADDTYSVAFESNSKWRRSLADSHPELFAKLGKGQAPQILWIGCADSRCPETTILGLQPGDIFCHRNIANILIPTDLNSLSVIQYAVQYLKVKHIIVCGHTSCGGVAAALDNKKLGLIDTWLMPLRHLRQKHIKTLEALSPSEAGLKLVDLNVRNSVSVLLENPIVLEAMVERDLKIHGVIYDVGTGELNELDITEDDQIVAERKAAFKTA